MACGWVCQSARWSGTSAGFLAVFLLRRDVLYSVRGQLNQLEVFIFFYKNFALKSLCKMISMNKKQKLFRKSFLPENGKTTQHILRCPICASSDLCFFLQADPQLCATLLPHSPSTLRCQPLGFPLLAQYKLKVWCSAISG